MADLTSHGNTQARHPQCTEALGWYEGHYTPAGEIECRMPSGERNWQAEAELKQRYPGFDAFIWGLFVAGDLPYSPDFAVHNVLQAHGVDQPGL